MQIVRLRSGCRRGCRCRCRARCRRGRAAAGFDTIPQAEQQVEDHGVIQDDLPPDVLHVGLCQHRALGGQRHLPQHDAVGVRRIGAGSADRLDQPGEDVGGLSARLTFRRREQVRDRAARRQRGRRSLAHQNRERFEDRARRAAITGLAVADHDRHHLGRARVVSQANRDRPAGDAASRLAAVVGHVGNVNRLSARDDDLAPQRVDGDAGHQCQPAAFANDQLQAAHHAAAQHHPVEQPALVVEIALLHIEMFDIEHLAIKVVIAGGCLQSSHRRVFLSAVRHCLPPKAPCRGEYRRNPGGGRSHAADR